MKVTYRWLKDFVDIAIAPAALADKLTMAGLEVKSIEEKHGDFVFEIEITSNRPDWLSVVGIAREVAAVTGVHSPKSIVHSKKKRHYGLRTIGSRLTSIKIENKKDCPLYTATVLRDVKVGPSPTWLRERLELVGCRSVNNVVDITNYVLFETGHPLHAFDLDKVSDTFSLQVRRAKKGETLVTIDGLQRTFDATMLVIAADKPVAVAGVMGGKDTEVTQDTKNVLLEAAVFDPVVVRRGRQALGLSSESSYRFERGLPVATVQGAALRAVSLLQELAQATCVSFASCGAQSKKNKRIPLDVARLNSILNISIPPAKIKAILGHLGFGARVQSNKSLLVECPAFRGDVDSQEDLCEEIARIYGYENIPVSLPAITPHTKEIQIRDIIASLKQLFAGLGLQEVITYSLVEKDSLVAGATPIEVENPLSADQSVLRTTLIPSIGRCIAHNLNQKQEHVAVFEIAKRFSQNDGSVEEEWTVVIGLCGARVFLLPQGKVKDEMGLLHLKGIIETLMSCLQIKEWRLTPSPGGDFALVIAGDRIGALLTLKQGQKDSLGVKNKDVFCAELSLSKLASFAKVSKHFRSLPLYPAITRDISFVIKNEITVATLVAAMRENASPLLQDIVITDSYKGKQIPCGLKGLTISCVYRSDERTLTEEEVSPVHSSISSVLFQKFGATLR